MKAKISFNFVIALVSAPSRCLALSRCSIKFGGRRKTSDLHVLPANMREQEGRGSKEKQGTNKRKLVVTGTNFPGLLLKLTASVEHRAAYPQPGAALSTETQINFGGKPHYKPCPSPGHAQHRQCYFQGLSRKNES